MDNYRVIYSSPYDARVEYLESTRTQWIDTGILNTYGTSVEVDFQIIDTGATSGQYDILMRNTGIFIKFTIGSGKLEINNGHRNNKTVPGNVYERRKIFIDSTSKTCLIDETEYTFSDEPTEFSHDYTLCLFSNARINGAVVKIYTAKFWDNGVLVRDFIPVRLGQVGYMYDRVSKQLFANQGTGNFVLGSDVYEPNFPKVRYVMYQKPYYSEVEYLQCNGTQWLNTELMLNSNCTIAVTAQVDVTSSPIWCARGYSGGTVYNTFSLLAVTDEVPQTTIRFDYSTTDVCNYFYYQDWNTKHTYKAIANNLYIDDVLVCTAEAATFNCGGELKIFNWVNAHDTTLNYNTTGKIFGVKVWNSSNVLIFDGIPVRKGNVGYLYDKVSGQLFGNSGTGNFILGPDLRVSERCVIEDKLYQEYKWLKGDGTAVINTNLYIEDYRQIKMSITVKDFTRYSKVTYFLAAGAITGSGYGFSLSVARSNASSQYRITKSDNSVTELCSLSGEHTIQMNNGNVYADGNFITSTFEYAPLSNIKLGIFGNISGSTQPANGYISNVTLESSVGNLDLVPCKLLQDIPAILDANGIARDAGECGMWNRVNNKFYGNIKSSGMFTVSN